MPSYGQRSKNLNDYLQGNPIKATTNFEDHQHGQVKDAQPESKPGEHF